MWSAKAPSPCCMEARSCMTASPVTTCSWQTSPCISTPQWHPSWCWLSLWLKGHTNKQLELQMKVLEDFTITKKPILYVNKQYDKQYDKWALRIYVNQTACHFWPLCQHPNSTSSFFELTPVSEECLKCESASRHFQLGGCPSRGHCRDCEILGELSFEALQGTVAVIARY